MVAIQYDHAVTVLRKLLVMDVIDMIPVSPIIRVVLRGNVHCHHVVLEVELQTVQQPGSHAALNFIKFPQKRIVIHNLTHIRVEFLFKTIQDS